MFPVTSKVPIRLLKTKRRLLRWVFSTAVADAAVPLHLPVVGFDRRNVAALRSEDQHVRGCFHISGANGRRRHFLLVQLPQPQSAAFPLMW